MSLWNKRLSEINFSDIEDFCTAGYPEGPQLDYKSQIPKDLSKLVASFANTLGGLILIGVDANQQTNTPNWPCDGIDTAKGQSERIMQMCRDNLHPPVMPEISSPISHPDNPEKVFLVVRVNESTSAPHSIRNSNKIYFRTGDINTPIDHMSIDRIAYLLERRKHPEQKRSFLLSRHLERCSTHIPTTGNPWFWWFACPEFPEDEICQVSDSCSGVFGGQGLKVLDGYTRLRARSGHQGDWIMSADGKHGDVFFARQFNRRRADEELPANSKPPINANFLANLTHTFFSHCQVFYNKPEIRHPGSLRLSIGGNDLLGVSLDISELDSGPPFIDSNFQIDRTTQLADLSQDDDLFDLCFHLASEQFHAFGLGPPLSRNHWKQVAC